MFVLQIYSSFGAHENYKVCQSKGYYCIFWLHLNTCSDPIKVNHQLNQNIANAIDILITLNRQCFNSALDLSHHLQIGFALCSTKAAVKFDLRHELG
jgi:hypothetical protein